MTEDELYAALETASTPDALLVLADWLGERMEVDAVSGPVAAWVVEEVREVAEGLGAEHRHTWFHDGECRCGAVATGSRRCSSNPVEPEAEALLSAVEIDVDPAQFARDVLAMEPRAITRRIMRHYGYDDDEIDHAEAWRLFYGGGCPPCVVTDLDTASHAVREVLSAIEELARAAGTEER